MSFFFCWVVWLVDGWAKLLFLGRELFLHKCFFSFIRGKYPVSVRLNFELHALQRA